MLNPSAQLRSPGRPLEQARSYRLVELVGRGSMLDVFVVAMLVALVNLDPLAVMRAGPAATGNDIVSCHARRGLVLGQSVDKTTLYRDVVGNESL